MNLPAYNRRDVHTMRFDHTLTDMTRLYVRYVISRFSTGQAPGTGFGVADPTAFDTKTPLQNAALNVSHLFSPSFFVNYTMGLNRVYVRNLGGGCCETDYGRLIGIPNAPGEVFPRFNFGGGLAPVTPIGAPNGLANRIATFMQTNVEANFTNIRGSQTLKFGSRYARYNGNINNRTNATGTFTSDGRFTRGVTAAGAAVANTGLPMADFLLGRLSAASAALNQSGQRFQFYSGYLQDDWRVTSALTLNLGIRYEIETPAYEVANRLGNFDPYVPSPLAGVGDIPRGAIGVMAFAGRNGNGRYLWNWDRNNFAPRFGFAWRVFGASHTTLRGGFGIFYGDPYAVNLLGYGGGAFASNYNATTPISYRLRDGLPKGALDAIPLSEITPTFGYRGTRFASSSAAFLERSRRTQYTESFNLTLQHQWKGVLFEAGYVGQMGRKVSSPNLNLNTIPPYLLAQTAISERLRRPWTVLAGDASTITGNSLGWGISNYHAFTFKSEQRYRSGIGWVAHYTFTRWIDNVSFQGPSQGDNDGPQNVYDFRNERSLSTNSVPHRLVLSPIIDFPFGRGKRWMNRGGVLDAMFGGWQISSLGVIRSGAPFGSTVLNGPRDLLGDQSAAQLRPNLIGDPHSPNQGQPAPGARGIQWLNAGAFARPERFTFGNAARTLPGILGPGSVNFDSMLAKNFYVGERWRAQFRWETFNSLNTPQFVLPNDVLGGTSFGIITNATSRRIMQFGLKLYW
jgi:hypothetical protein